VRAALSSTCSTGGSVAAAADDVTADDVTADDVTADDVTTDPCPSCVVLACNVALGWFDDRVTLSPVLHLGRPTLVSYVLFEIATEPEVSLGMATVYRVTIDDHEVGGRDYLHLDPLQDGIAGEFHFRINRKPQSPSASDDAQ